MDDTRNPSQETARLLHLAITDTEVQGYVSAFPSLDRESIVAAMLAHGPWRQDVERQLRGMFNEYVKPAQTGLSDKRLHTILNFIEASLHLPLSVADMAAAVGFSPFHFSRAFRRTLGQSPHVYLTLRRIERAKRLLARGDLALAAICAQVGYLRHSHFTEVFTRYVGMPPGRYRDSIARQGDSGGAQE